MSSKAQSTGMQGVFLVAAELAGRGLTVSTTSRNAIGADLLVTDAGCRTAFSVQVKTNSTKRSAWLVGPKAKPLHSPSHVYVLVTLHSDGKHDYFVVSSKTLADKVTLVRRPNSTWYSVSRRAVARFENEWSTFLPSRASNRQPAS